jgi:peptidoglycan/xylan/chitin deacetylase (PgdA/CDA1 family)
MTDEGTTRRRLLLGSAGAALLASAGGTLATNASADQLHLPMHHVVTVLPVKRKLAALTFDAGGNADGVPSILATLQGHHVTGTFFLTGHWARYYPGWAKRVTRSGHTIGSHSLTHPDFTKLSNAQVVHQLRGARQAIRAEAGVDPKPWFRFPYGAVNPRVLRLVNTSGWAAIGATIDTAGWLGTSGGQSVHTVLHRVKDYTQRGMIVLMHVGSNPDDGSTLDADALPQVIHYLRGRGYDFTTIDAILG